jgi:hypothetical protein
MLVFLKGCTKLCTVFTLKILFILSLAHPSINTVYSVWGLLSAIPSVINRCVHWSAGGVSLMLRGLRLATIWCRPISTGREVCLVMLYRPCSHITHTVTLCLFSSVSCVCAARLVICLQCPWLKEVALRSRNYLSCVLQAENKEFLNGTGSYSDCGSPVLKMFLARNFIPERSFTVSHNELLHV